MIQEAAPSFILLQLPIALMVVLLALWGVFVYIWARVANGPGLRQHVIRQWQIWGNTWRFWRLIFAWLALDFGLGIANIFIYPGQFVVIGLGGAILIALAIGVFLFYLF